MFMYVETTLTVCGRDQKCFGSFGLSMIKNSVGIKKKSSHDDIKKNDKTGELIHINPYKDYGINTDSGMNFANEIKIISPQK